MLKISLFTYLLITVKFHNTLELNESNLKLVFAIVRNGEHYPDKYALEYEKRFDEYSFQPGELLQLGQETMYDVGKKLRERYNEYLGDHSLTKYLVKTSGVKNKFSKRTLESALILQEGLRETEKKYVLNRTWTERQWSTVEDPNYTDRASYYYYKCDKYLEEQNKILQRELRKKVLGKYKEMLDVFRKNTNLELQPNKLNELFSLYELYYNEEISNIKRPDWLTEEIYSQFKELMNDYVEAAFATNALKSMAGGLHVKHLFDTINLMKDKKLQPCNTRMFLYVGNGAIVAPIFAAFGGEKGFEIKENPTNTIKSFNPKHGGLTIFEIYHIKETNDFYLKMFYSEDSKSEIIELTKPDCGYPCKVNKLRILLNDIYITKEDIKDLCDAVDSKKSTPK